MLEYNSGVNTFYENTQLLSKALITNCPPQYCCEQHNHKMCFLQRTQNQECSCNLTGCKMEKKKNQQNCGVKSHLLYFVTNCKNQGNSGYREL